MAAADGYARPTTGHKGSRRVAVLAAAAAAGMAAAAAPFRDGRLDQAMPVAGPAPLPGYAFAQAPDLVSALIPTDQIADGGDRELEGASGIATLRMGGSACAAAASPGANGVQMLRIPAVRPVPDHAFVTARKTAANHAGRDVPANHPPAVQAGPDQAVGEGQTVTISGTASDGDAPTCRRASEQSGLPVSGSDALSRSFTARQVDTATAFTPAADDGRGASSPDTVSATILAGSPPTSPQNLRAGSANTTTTPAWDDPNVCTVLGYRMLSRVVVAPTGPDLAVLVSDTGSADASHAVRNHGPDAICVFGAVAPNGHGEPACPSFARISTLMWR